MLQYSRIGRAMRAVADNRDLAEASGIDVARVTSYVWALGGALAALGGVMAGLNQVLHWQTGGRGGLQWAVRQGDWKLVVNGRDNGQGINRETSIPLWLSNLAADPGEQTNLAEANPEIVERLKALHQAETKRPLP
jgi:hypothetical protein